MFELKSVLSRASTVFLVCFSFVAVISLMSTTYWVTTGILNFTISLLSLIVQTCCQTPLFFAATIYLHREWGFHNEKIESLCLKILLAIVAIWVCESLFFMNFFSMLILAQMITVCIYENQIHKSKLLDFYNVWLLTLLVPLLPFVGTLATFVGARSATLNIAFFTLSFVQRNQNEDYIPSAHSLLRNVDILYQNFQSGAPYNLLLLLLGRSTSNPNQEASYHHPR